ncbi:hypothetical protein LQ757_18135 [Agromyces sp. SYSU K20354]|nr:hypothetical protein [Agromyces cavernae]
MPRAYADERLIDRDPKRRTTRHSIGDRRRLGRRLAPAEGARGVGSGIRQPHLLGGELHRPQAGREHEGDRGQRDRELRGHAALIAVSRP